MNPSHNQIQTLDHKNGTATTHLNRHRRDSGRGPSGWHGDGPILEMRNGIQQLAGMQQTPLNLLLKSNQAGDTPALLVRGSHFRPWRN